MNRVNIIEFNEEQSINPNIQSTLDLFCYKRLQNINMKYDINLNKIYLMISY